MNRRGMTTGALIGLIVAIAVVLIFASPTFGFYERIGNAFDIFIPDSWKSEVKPVGEDNLIGIELINKGAFNNKAQSAGGYFLESLSSPLKHYDGNAWVLYGKSQTIKVGSEDLNPDEIRNSLVNYYFFTERYGDGLFDYNRYFNLRAEVFASGVERPSFFASDKGRMRLKGEKKSGPITDEAIPMISVDFNDNFYNANNNVLSDSQFSRRLKNAVISYRDQITEEGLCEKYLDIGGNKYRVKKLSNSNYLYIDLSEGPSEPEKYKEGCFKSELSAKGGEYENNAEIFISFDMKNGVKGLYWGDKPGGKIGCKKGWYVLTGFDEYMPASAFTAGDFKISDIDRYDFQKGLDLFSEKLDMAGTGDYNNVVAYSIKGEKNNEFYRVDGNTQADTSGDRAKLKKAVIDEYNKGFVSSSDLPQNLELRKLSQVDSDPNTLPRLKFEVYTSIKSNSGSSEEQTDFIEWKPINGDWQWYLNDASLKNGISFGILDDYSFRFFNGRLTRDFVSGLPYVLKTQSFISPGDLTLYGRFVSNNDNARKIIIRASQLDLMIYYADNTEKDLSKAVNFYHVDNNGQVITKEYKYIEDYYADTEASFIYGPYNAIRDFYAYASDEDYC